MPHSVSHADRHACMLPGDYLHAFPVHKLRQRPSVPGGNSNKCFLYYLLILAVSKVSPPEDGHSFGNSREERVVCRKRQSLGSSQRQQMCFRLVCSCGSCTTLRVRTRRPSRGTSALTPSPSSRRAPRCHMQPSPSPACTVTPSFGVLRAPLLILVIYCLHTLHAYQPFLTSIKNQTTNQTTGPQGAVFTCSTHSMVHRTHVRRHTCDRVKGR
jgi:hypothetical protein